MTNTPKAVKQVAVNDIGSAEDFLAAVEKTLKFFNDGDLIAGTVHPIELFEFFYVLRKNNWEGVWQLDQFPFRDDHVEAAKMAIEFLKRVDKGLDRLDFAAMAEAQSRHDAITAGRLAREALFG